MNTITRKTTRKVAQIAAPIDLDEKGVPHTLDDLVNDDRFVVDVWDVDDQDGLTTIDMLGEEAVVEFVGVSLDNTLALVESRLRRGWGREGTLPEGVEVVRYDGQRPDLADPTASIFVQARREQFASWRLLADVTGVSA